MKRGQRVKKIIFSLVLFAAALILSYAYPEAKEIGKVKIKIATVLPKGSYVQNGIEEFCKEVRKATNNTVGFKIYAGGVQGDEIDVIRKIRLKQLNGGFFSTYALCRIVPEVKVTEVPFVFRNHEEVSYVRSRMEDIMNKYFEEKGFVVLGWTDLGFIHVFSDAPITSTEILRKQKIWVWGDDPVVRAIFKEGLELELIPLSLTDVMTALSTNLVDTVCLTPFHVVAFRWHTDLKYMGEVPLFRGVGAFLVTKDIWDKISPENQAGIKKTIKRSIEKTNMSNRDAYEKAIELLKKAGISILPAEDLEYLVKSGEKARNSLVGKVYSRELLDRSLSLLEEYRRDHPNSAYVRIE